MRWAYDAVYSWLGVLSVRAHEVSCRVRAGEVARPAIVSRVDTSSASPQGAASGSRVRFRWTGWVPRLHPRCLLVFPPNGWSSARKGGEGPPLGKARLAWVTTVTGDADHVTFCEISVSRLGQTFQGPLKPHDTSAFPQLQTWLYLPVAIS